MTPLNKMKSLAKRVLENRGVEVRRNNLQSLNVALRQHITGSRPVLFDVGANKGQTVQQLKAAFALGEVHAFEPSPATFRDLSQVAAGLPGVTLNNCGVGAEPGTLPLQENEHSELSSFLPPDQRLWGDLQKQTEVPIVTVDGYSADHDIASINLLKTDTQGFDLQVIDGASKLLAANRIQMILTELMFVPLYQGQTDPLDLIGHVRAQGFRLVGFYNYGYRDDAVGWCDALFVNLDYEGD